ncbi:MAG: GerMN domain-containing protein [Candidatus Tectomicrobia bacterium]|nr:GerMN domain-containing protein [Candidatus Tectomicrobia bacterium]
MRWIWPALIALGVGVGILFFNVERVDREPGRPAVETPPPGQVAPPTGPERAPASPKRRRFVLLFAATDGEGLRPEPRELREPPALHDAVRQVLDELIQGPRAGLVETLPRGVRILEVFLDGQGTAYVDFSKELSTAHPGGAWAEALTVASIVQTLTANFEAIQKVAILVEGKSVETLAGHVDIRRPLTRLDTRFALVGTGEAPSAPR